MYACRRPSANREGFTLLELVIVMLIFSIFAAVAAPRYLDALDRARADAAAKRIAADLQLAQRYAQRTSTSQSIVFDVANNRYVFSDMPDLDHADQTYAFDLGDMDYQTVLKSADFNGSSTLTFDIYGRPDNNGAVVVKSGSYEQTLTIGTAGAVSAF